ncbi:hypothetical protein FIBSPDRAFT_902496 [Athelia psychrophila]|uniref:Uncharacterized protein n=1 Tax=Athelia psychrophila TaxID=1759441 RepID=A0A167X5U4_9AGAM|nr:hypothetical protein FIBSPDRAFT_902496 [Fibularhizoctonia sp. CBS 109695]
MIAHRIMEYDEPKFKWGLIMLKCWNYLMPVIHMLPQLAPSCGDPHLHPIPTPDNGAVPEATLHCLEMSDNQMTQLYAKLPLAERLDLQLIHGDGGKALALCRGQVAIFIRLLEHLGNSYSSSIDALKLAYDSIKPMESYLNGRYSCCGDQSRLVQLCLDYTHHRDTLDRLQPQRFCIDEILLRVLGTIGDPEIIQKAKQAVRVYSVATNGKYRTAADMTYDHSLQLQDAIPLPAMEDYEIERSDPLLERHRGTSLTSVFDDSSHVLWHAVAASLGRAGIENRTELDQT